MNSYIERFLKGPIRKTFLKDDVRSRIEINFKWEKEFDYDYTI